MTKPKVIAIGGPTATGKTGLSVLLAKELGGEVVSCDSMQIYKGMEIGTAAPTLEEQEGIPHHMVGFADPTVPYSVADYVEAARPIIEGIVARGKLPIVVGGTGLYMDSLLSGREYFEQVESDIRDQLMAQDEMALWERLHALDEVAAAGIHPQNKRRVVRALETVLITGERMSERSKRQSAGISPYDTIKIVLDYEDREILRNRCNMRVDLMMEQGLEAEVRSLLLLEGIRNSTAIKAIGYKELLEYIDGMATLEEAVTKTKSATRRYAKRQRTWFKMDKSALWFFREHFEFTAILDKIRQDGLI